MQKSHISGQPQSTRQSRSRAAMSLRTAAQRRSRSRSESRGSSSVSRIFRLLLPLPSGERELASTSLGFEPLSFLRRLQLQPLQAFQIIGDAAREIELPPVAELIAGAGDVVDAVHRVGRAEEVQSRPDVDHGVRQVLAQNGGDVFQRHADAGADVEYPAFEAVRCGGEVNAERGILVVDEVVLLIAALSEVERLTARRPLDDLAGHAHIAVARGLAGP